MFRFALILSFFIHLAWLWGLTSKEKEKPRLKIDKIEVKLIRKTKPKPVVTPKPAPIATPKPTPVATPKPKPIKPPPKKKAKAKKKKKTAAPTRRKPKNKPKKNAKAIQGLTEDSLVSPDTKTRSSMQAPAGNTMLIPDQGIRVDPSQVQELEQNLAADAILIRSSIIVPELTDEALDAGLERRVRVEVFVDELGAATDTQLDRRVGYGMDRLLLQSARKARFIPRKDKEGRPMSGWSYIVFQLVQP